MANGAVRSKANWTVISIALAAVGAFVVYVLHDEAIRRDLFWQRATTIALIFGIAVLFFAGLTIRARLSIPQLARTVSAGTQGMTATIVCVGALFLFLLGPVWNLMFPKNQIISGNIYYKIAKREEELRPVPDVIVQIPQTDQRSQPTSNEGRFTITNLSFQPKNLNALFGDSTYAFEAAKSNPGRYPIIPPIPECPETKSEYEKCAAASNEEKTGEQYVLNQLQSDAPATCEDFVKRGHQEFVIRGCFVRQLLARRSQQEMIIDGATVHGSVDIRDLDIPFHLELINCRFEGDVNMKRSHFMKGVSFKSSSFGSGSKELGRLDAEDAVIDDDFNLDECTFYNCMTFLKGMRVGVDLRLKGAKFLGSVDFTGTVIGGNLFADQDEPTNEPTNAWTQFSDSDFEGVKVGLDANLTEVVFHGPASFNNATFNNLGLEHSIFYQSASFKSTQVSDLYLGRDAKNRFRAPIMIEDLSFQYMSPEDLDELRAFAENSNKTPQLTQRNAQFYSTLEAILRKHGHEDWADEVYIAGKRKERQWSAWYGKSWDMFLDVFIGYGRHVGRLLIWSLVFISLGTLLFWSESKMIRKEPDKFAPDYNPFLYSLDLFLPIIGLGYAEIWTPNSVRKRVYKVVHMIIGNLFIPIGLAALTGIIK